MATNEERNCIADGGYGQSVSPDRCELTFKMWGVSFVADVDTVYWNRGGAVFVGGM